LNKKLAANEKVRENLNSTIESFTSTMKNQLSFNKNDRNSTGSACFFFTFF
jgi:hypothetical protein